MKTWNFPAKKLARQIIAQMGVNKRPFDEAELLKLDAARSKRTKGFKGNKMPKAA